MKHETTEIVVLEDEMKCLVIKPHGHYIDFEIYNIAIGLPDGKPLYYSATDDTPETYENIEDATPYIRGHIKWDGCCNYEYPEEGMLHHCGFGGFRREYETIKTAYKYAAKYMPDRAADLLDER
jgi:hypothetical protein